MIVLKKAGKVVPKDSRNIKKSRIGLGFEKLDRDIFDPENSYPFVEHSGVKWARLQSGWQKTERERGVYDFSWLDKIVDKMADMGVETWLCLCYGNKLYTKSAKTVFGAVGCPPIKTKEERTAWQNYVKATAEHFKGRIHYYEIWNEPDGTWCWKHGPNPDELTEFTIATAKALKEVDSSCETVGLVTCMSGSEFHERMGELGVFDHLDAVSYHAYSASNDWEFRDVFGFYDNLRKKYNPKLKIIQGESGTQSSRFGCGALAGGDWTEEKQAKYLLRHLITDLNLGVEFTSYFSCMDMAEALNGSVGDVMSVSDFGYFGVVGADFDENARATGNYHTKLSYFALQNLTSVLCEDYESENIEFTAIREFSQGMLSDNFDFSQAQKCVFKRNNGETAIFYWKDANFLSETYSGETSFMFKCDLEPETVELIDMFDGSIYEIDGEHMYKEGEYLRFKNLPITDSPLMININSFYIKGDK